jgi:hypothetical protein
MGYTSREYIAIVTAGVRHDLPRTGYRKQVQNEAKPELLGRNNTKGRDILPTLFYSLVFSNI